MEEHSQPSERLGWGLFLAVFALWLYESAVLLQPELRFTADCERDLFQVLGLSHYGVAPDSGILMAALGWDLGPLYFLLMAPFNWLWPSPQTVHFFNMAICGGGLIAAFVWLRSSYGLTAALIALLLYTQSAAHGAFVDTVWHVGATPGITLAMLACAGWWFRSGRRAALLGCTTLALVLVQLHALGMTYLPILLALLILGRKHMNKKAWTLFGATAFIVALPWLLYLLPSLGQSGGSAARHAGGLAFRPGAYWDGLQALLQSKFLFATSWAGIAVEALLAVGVFAVIREFIQGKRPWFDAILVFQLLLGSIIVSLVVPYEMVGRYYLPVIFPIFFLVARGVAAAEQWLASRRRTQTGRALTWTALLLGLALSGPYQNGQLSAQPPSSNHDYLSLTEQEAAVEYLVKDKGLDWIQIRGRVHGAFFGPFSGIRYLTRVAELAADNKAPSTQNAHFLVSPAGAPKSQFEPITSTSIKSGHRTLFIDEFEAIVTQKIGGENGPCFFPFPYLWSESRSELLKAIGFPLGHGPDVHRCFKDGKGGTLIIPLGPKAVWLNLQISDDGHFRDADEAAIKARISAKIFTPDLPREIRTMPLPFTHQKGVEKDWYSAFIHKHESNRELHLTIRPVGNLSFLDLY